MPRLRVPDVDVCCGCITDLRTASAIIAVLGIVTSPVVSWAIVRHAYVIRVSCFITTNAGKPDVIDINLNNMLSFGFGANAGLGPSCLRRSKNNAERDDILRTNIDPASPEFVAVVKYFGWIVLIADIVFLISSILFILEMFKYSQTNVQNEQENIMGRRHVKHKDKEKFSKEKGKVEEADKNTQTDDPKYHDRGILNTPNKNNWVAFKKFGNKACSKENPRV